MNVGPRVTGVRATCVSMGTGESSLESERATGVLESARPSRAWSSALMAKVRALDLDEPLIIVSLLSLCVLVRVLWLRPIEVYWDATAKWHFVRQWSFANDFEHARWTHHMARLGVHLPTYLVQLVLGTATRVYHVVPIGAFALQTLMVYLLGRRLSGRAAGVIGALFMSLSPAMNRSASQLLPDGIAGTAAVIAGYALVRFHEEEGRARLRWLVAGALACAWAYAIKESSVLLFPGMCLAVWYSRGRLKEGLLFAGMLAAYGALETLGFRLFTDYSHRLAIIQGGHGYYPPTSFLGLFDRFNRLEPAGKLLFWMWFASVFYHLRSPDKRRRLLLIVPLGFILLLTFMVRRIDPLTVWQSAKPRYMAPAMGLMVVGAAVFVVDVLKRAGGAWHWQPPKRAAAFIGSFAGVSTFLVCASLGAVTYVRERPYLAEHPFVTQRRNAIILNDAFRRNLPIIERARNPRGLNTVYGIYLKSTYLAQSDLARDGWLPNIQDGVRSTRIGKRRYGYVLRDASRYERGELAKLVKRGCAIVVTAPGSVHLNVTEKLPDRCRAPRGDILPR
jgi:Dolichyl-phosphate-mannose-protein mannosyltransferase